MAVLTLPESGNLKRTPAFASPPISFERFAADIEAGEWQAVYELCCLTGNNGAPIAPDRWNFFGRLWVAPYRSLVPEWTYVAKNAAGIVGYLTGCPDTRAFARGKFIRCTLPLLFDIARGRYPLTQDARVFVKQAFHFSRASEHSFSRAARRLIQREYPAHLHVNVAAAYRSVGIGKQLLERFFSDLRTAQVRGVHVFCGADPAPFYFKRGFEPIGSIRYRGGLVFALGRRC
jgi:GNAT superfamily N-acetyltransferase